MRYESSIKGDNIITKYDKEEEEPQKIKQNESGALRLTHKSSKNFAQGVDEKIVLCIWNVTHVRQARCKRFNLRIQTQLLLFLIGKITYYHRKYFLKK